MIDLKLFGDDPYYVVLNVSVFDGTNDVDITTTFNKKQAKVAYDVLSQNRQTRILWGQNILNGLEQLRTSKTLQVGTMFTATLRDASSGILQTIPVQLHWRAMRMLALMTVNGSETKIAQLVGVFKNIEAGMYENRKTLNPFLVLEGK